MTVRTDDIEGLSRFCLHPFSTDIRLVMEKLWIVKLYWSVPASDCYLNLHDSPWMEVDQPWLSFLFASWEFKLYVGNVIISETILYARSIFGVIQTNPRMCDEIGYVRRGADGSCQVGIRCFFKPHQEQDGFSKVDSKIGCTQTVQISETTCVRRSQVRAACHRKHTQHWQAGYGDENWLKIWSRIADDHLWKSMKRSLCIDIASSKSNKDLVGYLMVKVPLVNLTSVSSSKAEVHQAWLALLSERNVLSFSSWL